MGALWPQPRISGLAVTATTGMTLNVTPGQVAIPTANGTGTTLCTSDATEQVNIGAAPVSGTNRIDLVVATARGNDLDGGVNDDWVLQVIAGTVAASPVAPTVPAGSVALAQVYVGGGVASIAQANITDRRPASLFVPAAIPRGIICHGPALANYGNAAIVPMNAVDAGAAGWLANNTVTIPADAGGLYEVGLDVGFIVGSVVANGASITSSGGAQYTPTMQVVFLTDSFSGSWWWRMSGKWLHQFNGGATLQVRSMNVGTSGQIGVYGFSLRRVADSLGTS